MNKALTAAQIKTSLKKLDGWSVTGENKVIYRALIVQDFSGAVDLINRIAQIAEEMNHHPDIHLTDYRKLRIELTTHDVGGLSKNDFLMAGRINDLPVRLKR